jgi:hypothetical protein
LLALCIRLAIIFFVSDPQHPQMYEHGEIANNLDRGHGFTMYWPYTSLNPQRAQLMKQPPQFETAFMPPINPYQIFFIYKIFGETAAAISIIMILNALYSSLIPLAVYHTAKLFSSDSESRISTLLSALFLPAAFAVTTFSGSSLYQLIVVLTFGFAIRSIQKPSYKNFILFGFCAAVMTLLRSEFLILGFILIAEAGYCVYKYKRKIFSPNYFFAGFITFALVIAPWTIRNYNLFGKLIPVVDHPWHEIWRGNNIYANGSSYDSAGNPVWENATQYPQIIKAMDELPYDQQFDLRADSVFRHEAVEFIADHPAKFAELGAIKIFSLFTIDYHHPETRNPLYYIFMMLVIIPVIIGISVLFKNSRSSHDYSIFALYVVFFLYYCAVIVSTFILPRYQIYIFSAALPLTGIGWRKGMEMLKLKIPLT